MRRRKKSGGGATNFWPGYVDAMVNVVLNLLFMVAMFGITLAVFSQQNKKGKADPNSAATAVAPPPDASLGWPAAPVVPPSALDRAPGDVGTPAVIQVPPAPMVSGPPAPGTAVAPDGAGRAEAGLAPAGQSALAGRGAAPADVAGAGRTARSGREAGPDTTDIVVADASGRRKGPPITVTRRATASGQIVLTLDAEPGSDPVGVFQRPAVANALKGAIRPGSRQVKLWTSITRADPAMRRNAYLALATLRNQLITIGLPPSSMEVRVYEGAGPASGGLRLFVVATP